jgi:hypothetical protein
MQLVELKQTLASVARSLDGTGKQIEDRELILRANIMIAELLYISTSHRGNHEAVGSAIRLIRQAGRALLRGERQLAARILLNVSNDLPDELPTQTRR